KQQENEQLSYYAGVILAEAFGDVLASRTVEAVVCVPLHWTRRLWRGYNQAETLARAVATRWNLPFYSHWLCRRRSTSRQATLTPTQRRKNLTLAMQASIPTKYRGRHVLLVDDVVTTGATVDACSKALLSAGARQVTVLALARATGTRIT
ncbi:MAG TPA: phosphoribosyltransferase family protein, partial [Gemmatales bacterium]|nr:phosphoribosyltransferase family protein [Gemmatales bacterium]